MSRPLIVSIPQKLGRQEARRRLDSGISRLQPELSAILSGLDYHWENDTLHFIASAMWQRITGRIEVLDDTVRIEIDLPWVMQLLADIARRVRSRGIALLAAGPRLRNFSIPPFSAVSESVIVNGRSRELKPRTRRDFAGVRDGSRRRFAQLYLPLLKTHPFPVSSLGALSRPKGMCHAHLNLAAA